MSLKRPIAILGAITWVVSLLVAAWTAPAVAATGNMPSPVPVGQTWYIYQGYNSGTHPSPSGYALDLTIGPSTTSTAGRAVVAPLAGTIHYWQAAYGNLCVNTNDGRSFTLTHINPSKTSGSVAPGEVLGTVGAAGTLKNNGVAHLHFQVWSGKGCYNQSPQIPLDSAHNTRMCGAPDLTPTGPSSGNGTWSGTYFTAQNCDGGGGQPADSDADGTPDSADLEPYAPGGARNRGVPVEGNRQAGDFNGDGKRDIAVFYDYGGGRTKLWVLRGSSTGPKVPIMVWDSGVGNWGWDRSKPVIGDYTGDGKADLGVFYDYGGGLTKLWLFRGSSTGLKVPTIVWDSGPGNWDWSRIKAVSGKFNGDAKSDIGVFYDHGGGRTALWLFRGTSTGVAAPTMNWDSGAGNWGWAQTKAVAGDFDANGRTDIGAFFNYGGGRTKLWVFRGSSTGIKSPTMVWDSGPGNWDWNSTLPVSGKFNGDGKADIGVFYGYSHYQTKLWLFRGSTSGFALPTVNWDSGQGNWDWNNMKPVAGDFQGDGRSDVGVFYNYGGAQTKLWWFRGSTTGLRIPTMIWDSGPGNWGWASSLVN